MSVLAIDIGATKFAVGLVREDRTIICKEEIPSSLLWDGLSALITRIANQADGTILKIGIGSAGPINTQSGEISPVNIPQWKKFPLIRSVNGLLPEAHIELVGDAVALAIAEHRIGAGRGARSMLGMVVSTGIGGGLIVDGRPLMGDYGNAGYFGHNVVGDYDGGCNCGRIGCIEGYASGPSMVRYANKSGWAGKEFIELAKSAEDGDSAAISAIKFGTEHLAKAFINIAHIFDLHTIVIGGGVAEAGDIYWKPLIHAVNEQSISLGLVEPIKLLPAHLKRDAGLIGAAMAVGLE